MFSLWLFLSPGNGCLMKSKQIWNHFQKANLQMIVLFYLRSLPQVSLEAKLTLPLSKVLLIQKKIRNEMNAKSIGKVQWTRIDQQTKLRAHTLNISSKHGMLWQTYSLQGLYIDCNVWSNHYKGHQKRIFVRFILWSKFWGKDFVRKFYLCQWRENLCYINRNV